MNHEEEKLLRDRWWHEDHLINHRLTWLLASQTIVGVAYGYLKREFQTDVSFQKIATALPWFGLASSVLVFLGITAAIHAQRRLKAEFPNVTFQASKGATRLGWVAAWGLSLLFVIGWLVGVCIKTT